MRADTVACAVSSGRPADKSGIPVLLSPFPLPAEHRPHVGAHSLTRSCLTQVGTHTLTHSCPRAGLPVAAWWPSAVTSSSLGSQNVEVPGEVGFPVATRTLMSSRCLGSPLKPCCGLIGPRVTRTFCFPLCHLVGGGLQWVGRGC